MDRRVFGLDKTAEKRYTGNVRTNHNATFDFEEKDGDCRRKNSAGERVPAD